MTMAIHTIGYGIAKWPEFAQRLHDAKITEIIDVRRKGSKSRNGRKFYQTEDGMKASLKPEGIAYSSEPSLARGRQDGLTRYHSRLYYALRYSTGPESPAYVRVRDKFEVEDRHSKIALLCGCRDVSRCHRKILANFLLEELEVAVVHL